MAKTNQNKGAVKTKDKRNLKYGSLSVTITVIFVALVIILNIIATSLSSVQGWYTDMTASSYYSLSDAFIEEMNKLLIPENGEKTYLNIVLLAEEDVFRNYNEMTVMLYQTFKELVNHYDNINLVAHNTTVHPEYAEKYKATALDTLSMDDVVFELCDENGNALPNIPAKKYTSSSFFMMDTGTNSYIGYNAETKILSAVALLAGKADRPTAYYLQGHGEPTLEEAGDWKEVLELGGFNVEEIKLSDTSKENEEMLAKFEASKADDIIIINRPKTDLVHTIEFSEITKLKAFLGNRHGHMIVVEDAEVPKLRALEDLMSEYGLGFGNSVKDNQHSVSGSGAAKIFADYSQTYNPNTDAQSTSTGFFAKLFHSKTSNLPSTIFTLPKEVVILDSREIVTATNSSAVSFPLLKSYTSAQTVKGEKTVEGSVALMGVSRIIWELNDNIDTYVVAIGSSDFLSAEYESSCANRNVMLEILRLMWDNTIYYDNISYKSFDNTSLTDVSTAQANAWTILCVAVIPVAIGICGLIVYVRRRHS